MGQTPVPVSERQCPSHFFEALAPHAPLVPESLEPLQRGAWKRGAMHRSGATERHARWIYDHSDGMRAVLDPKEGERSGGNDPFSGFSSSPAHPERRRRVQGTSHSADGTFDWRLLQGNHPHCPRYNRVLEIEEDPLESLPPGFPNWKMSASCRACRIKTLQQRLCVHNCVPSS